MNPYSHHHYYHEKAFVRKQGTLILKVRHHILYGVALINQKRGIAMIPYDRLIKYSTIFLEWGIDNVEKLLERDDFDKFSITILNKQLEEYKHDLEVIKGEC